MKVIYQGIFNDMLDAMKCAALRNEKITKFILTEEEYRQFRKECDTSPVSPDDLFHGITIHSPDN